MTIEYRIGWSANSNITFKGKTDWREWDGFEETIEEVESALEKGGSEISPALEEALQASGFEFWSQVREKK